jgi:hypothetical protein
MTTTDPSSGSTAPRDVHVTPDTGRLIVEGRGVSVSVSSAYAVAAAAYPDQKEGIDALVQQFAALSNPHLVAAEAHPASYVGNTNLPEAVVGALARSEREQRETRRAWRLSLIGGVVLGVTTGIIGWLFR